MAITAGIVLASFAGQASAQWVSGSGLIYYNSGKVGIGIHSAPEQAMGGADGQAQ